MNGQKLRERREAAGLTQTELAAKCCITQTMVTKIEAGLKFPSVLVLKKIAEVLGTTIDDLVS